MKRINYYLLLLATMLCVSSLNAQKEYSIDCVTAVSYTHLTLPTNSRV